ncbi:hypothetical protein DL89DRAFT_47731 [Linderina pennispora]|uniref:Uncharacterized protein n=1 Tax=Linderina pennispora TaxID=61395 RepID=A0A1Y1W232_9FUNG|nr:uncharacterized protein DL89DRAFT_47731 [Linderina pennispora]ORX67603.1 hypothetical protein DL89DRAFT_47731 [Linderina pennispora]
MCCGGFLFLLFSSSPFLHKERRGSGMRKGAYRQREWSADTRAHKVFSCAFVSMSQVEDIGRDLRSAFMPGSAQPFALGAKQAHMPIVCTWPCWLPLFSALTREV